MSEPVIPPEDDLVFIDETVPATGQVPSLNVSVAAAIVMYEVARQRRTKPDKKKA